MSEILQKLEAAARQVSAAVNHEVPATARVEVTVHSGGLVAVQYGVTTGDICDRGKWPWMSEFAPSIETAASKLCDTVRARSNDRSAQVQQLAAQAAKLGMQLVEKQEGAAA